MRQKIVRPDIALPVSGILFLTAALMFYSPLNSAHGQSVTTDQAVFLTIAQKFLSGRIPYVDFFDHKGPLLYFILALGLRVDGVTGCYILECGFAFLTVFFSYRIARLFTGPGISFFVCMAVYLSNIGLLSRSNSEEYIMPFLCLSVLLFFRQLFQCVRLREIFLMGLCGMAVFFIKYNYCLIWAFMGIVVFFKVLRQKGIRGALQTAACFFGGMAVSTIPFIVYFRMTGSFRAFLDSYVLYSIHYAGYTGISDRLACVRFLLSYLLAVSLALMLVVWLVRCAAAVFPAPGSGNPAKKAGWKGRLRQAAAQMDACADSTGHSFLYAGVWILLMAAMIIVSTASPGQSWVYYLQCTMVAYIPCIAMFCELLRGLVQNRWPAAAAAGLAVLPAVGFLICGWHAYPYRLQADPGGESTAHIAEILRQNCGEQDCVLSFSNDCAIYFYSECDIASRILFPSAAIVDRELEEELFADLQSRQPLYLSFHRDWKSGLPAEMIDRTEEIVSAFYATVYEDGIHTLYQRNSAMETP